MANPNPVDRRGNLTPGNPGNKGGGNISNAVRKACAEGFAKAVPKIIQIASNEADGVTPNEQVAAFNALGKYGVGQLEAVALENADWLKVVAEVTSRHFDTPEKFESWWQEVMATLDSMK